jgi:2-C-methyl-D-erythritol 2,4-cyclodiphosphate synthase
MTEYRIGSGFDVHRLEEGLPLVIGGVSIPHDRGAVAHSDGDVLLHALTDALLGAVGKGDIGTMFPDTDPAWQNTPGDVFVQGALDAIGPGWEVVNIDATVFLEQPKMVPHRDAIVSRIAEIIGIPADRINTKAKTAEKLGPIGSNDAVGAHVSVLLCSCT